MTYLKAQRSDEPYSVVNIKIRCSLLFWMKKNYLYSWEKRDWIKFKWWIIPLFCILIEKIYFKLISRDVIKIKLDKMFNYCYLEINLLYHVCCYFQIHLYFYKIKLIKWSNIIKIIVDNTHIKLNSANLSFEDVKKIYVNISNSEFICNLWI